MSLDGINHVAVLTKGTQRLVASCREVFEAEVTLDREESPGVRLSVVSVGPMAELNVFQIEGNHEAERQVPMFGRGRPDHLALRAPDLEAFTEIRRRLIGRGAAEGFVTDFGPILSLFLRDPDGLEGAVVVTNPAARPGEHHLPGTPAARFVVKDEEPNP